MCFLIYILHMYYISSLQIFFVYIEPVKSYLEF